VFYEKTFGTQSVDPSSPLLEKPLSMDTTMWIASCTKLLTAVSVMQCVEKGLLDLDADVSTILTEWKDAPLLKGFEKETGTPIIEKAKNKITLKRLLTHSNGLNYAFFDPRLHRWAKHERLVLTDDSSLVSILFFSESHLTNRLKHDVAFTPLVFEPGESWIYGVGCEWAGQMVERVNGNQKLGDYMQEHIWGPLGMKSTTFRIDAREDIRSRRLDMSMRNPVTEELMQSPTRFWSEKYKDDFGGGGLYSCAADYIKVLHALLGNDGTLLKPSSIDTLFTPCLSDAAKTAFNNTLYATYPGNENGEFNLIFTCGIPQYADLDYAIGGFVVGKDVVGRRKKGTVAWQGMPNLYWMIDRQSGLALFFCESVDSAWGQAELRHLPEI
jgi:CubicO group peptidase (beta-lactamase class C family)